MSDRRKAGAGLAKERTGYVAKAWIRRTIDPTTRREHFVMATIVGGREEWWEFFYLPQVRNATYPTTKVGGCLNSVYIL